MGAVPVETSYSKGGYSEVASYTPIGGAQGTSPAVGALIPYNPPTCTDVTKDGGACTAQRAKGTLFCVGHLRKRGELGDSS